MPDITAFIDYRLAFELAPVGLVLSRHRTMVDCNQAVCEMFGVTRDQLMMRMSDDDWLQVIEVNLNSVFRLSRGVLRGMMKARWGRIINITSVVAQAGNPGQANYAAAKAGVAGMSRSLAQEVASRGVTVNCVAPGLIATAMTDKLNDEQRGKILAGVPAGRMGLPEEVAAAVVFLASAEAGYVTGATLDVNGGGDML